MCDKTETENPTPQDPLQAAVCAIEDALDADVFLFAGPIERGGDSVICCEIEAVRNRSNAALCLETAGGSPDAAYRIGRAFQEVYGDKARLTLLLDSYCKSAGTLLACAFDEIVMSVTAELGPLDIQITPRDELAHLTSGLIHQQALSELQEQAYYMFESYFLDIIEKSGGQIRTRSAMSMASELVIGLMRPLYEQIDPVRLGEVSRANAIGSDYAARLDRT